MNLPSVAQTVFLFLTNFLKENAYIHIKPMSRLWCTAEQTELAYDVLFVNVIEFLGIPRGLIVTNLLSKSRNFCLRQALRQSSGDPFTFCVFNISMSLSKVRLLLYAVSSL